MNYVDAKRQGIDLSKPVRDPVIPAGMPGNSCQMFHQISSDIMKNLGRKHPLEISESSGVNKWRYKQPKLDNLAQADSEKVSQLEKAAEVMELERKMAARMSPAELNPKMPQVLEQFLTASLTKHQKSRYLMNKESASQKLKPRIHRLRDAYIEYESCKLAEKIKHQL